LVLQVGDGEITNVRIVDLAGKVVLERSGLHTSRVQLPIRVASGSYMVRVLTSSGMASAKVLLP
ncbi:MAG TPA: T9SS type A sorting domain-containing protein, partial [Flavobacteriales bacterium]|nr:T9SS type A sorting domain-containing protein [Flavobacteriales bacterium]